MSKGKSGGDSYERLSQRVWYDEFFLGLSKPAPCGRFLWIVLTAGPYCTPVPGLLVVGEAALAEFLGWPVKKFREAFSEIVDAGKAEADWKAGLIWVKNSIRHKRPANPSVVKGWRSRWALIPECDLKSRARKHLTDFFRAHLSQEHQQAFAEVCGAAPVGTDRPEADERPPEPVPAHGSPPTDTGILAREYLARRRGGNDHERLTAADEFQELLEFGFSADFLLEKIKEKGTHTGELVWIFKKRLLAAGLPKPKAETPEEFQIRMAAEQAARRERFNA